MVERGRFDYANLPRIYCIAFLEKSILPTLHYHTLATLRSEQGEPIDDQLTFITVELAKFDKPVAAIHTDLDKLIYTMKTLHEATDPAEYPAFWNEQWLQRAIDELNTRKMTPEERSQFARYTAINAEAVIAERARLSGIIQRSLQQGLTAEQIAEINEVSVDYVRELQQKLSD